MPEEIYPNLYRIKIPLPESPLKYLNSYLIKGNGRNLLVDTGLNRNLCKTAMLDGLKELSIELDTVDIFITHLHADHFGLLPKLVTDKTRVYFNRPDSEIIENWQGFEPMVKYAALNGFPEAILRSAISQHPGFKYGTDWMPALSILNDGDTLDIGAYHFTCIHTPGHTQGHTCLYEAQKHFLIAGDHLLNDITPNIQCWSDDTNPLKDYLESLAKIRGLAVEKVLPGHRRLFTHFRERIDELTSHHHHRIEEVMSILKKKSPQSAYTVASEMTWDISADSWEDFPVAQKWFATGEALSHLRYLEEENRIVKTSASPVVEFAPAA